MRKLFIASAVIAFAFASSASAKGRYCEGAVSKAACKAHKKYVRSLKEIKDTSPNYMKYLDPRYNESMNLAGDGGGGGSGGAP